MFTNTLSRNRNCAYHEHQVTIQLSRLKEWQNKGRDQQNLHNSKFYNLHMLSLPKSIWVGLICRWITQHIHNEFPKFLLCLYTMYIKWHKYTSHIVVTSYITSYCMYRRTRLAFQSLNYFWQSLVHGEKKELIDLKQV